MPRTTVMLVGLSPQVKGLQWQADQTLRIGSSYSQDVVLHDRTVSPAHAEVLFTGQDWRLRDLNSAQGTFLNGGRVGPVPQELHEHDVIRCGGQSLLVTGLGHRDPLAGSEVLAAAGDSIPTLAGAVLTKARARPTQFGRMVSPLDSPGGESLLCLADVVAETVDVRNGYERGHSRRVMGYSALLAEEFRLSAHERHQIQLAALLRDVGTIFIDDVILREASILTLHQLDIIKGHPIEGAALLASLPGLDALAPVVRAHHECWDGLGYPDGKRRDQVCLAARIIAVADAFDAMICDRPYRGARSPHEAFDELTELSGRQFDPECVRVFHALRPRIEELMAQAAEGSKWVGVAS